MTKLTREDLPALTDKAAAKILDAVKERPGYYSPASLVRDLEEGILEGVGKVVTYWGADNRPHSDAPGAVALWCLISDGEVHLSNEWALYPEGE